MGLIPTLMIMGAALAFAAFARWKANQPYEPGVPRYINWTLVMIFAGAVAILMLVHLFSLAGIDVGQGRPR
jgi:hypothetical protein